MTRKKVSKKKIEQVLRNLAHDVLDIRKEETARARNISYDYEFEYNPALNYFAPHLQNPLLQEVAVYSRADWAVVLRSMNLETYKTTQKVLTNFIPKGPLAQPDLDSLVRRIHLEKHIDSVVENAISELFGETVSWNFYVGLLDVTILNDELDIGDLKITRPLESPHSNLLRELGETAS